jgi:lysophosphatidylcholine acyltransferase/lyso-PAF acetyltransferase
VSYLDILWAQSAHCPALVAKYGVQSVPFIGTLARAWQCVWVGGALDGTRGGGDASQLVTRVNNDDASLTPLLVFAEGTTTNGEYLLPFRTGAFIAGQPVQPVILRYHSALFSQGWETIPVWLHLFLSLSQWRSVLEVTYLPLYRPSEQERTSARLYADNVRRLMSERSVSALHPRKLKLSNATVREKRLFHQLIIKRIYSWRDPFESGIAVVPSGFSTK